MSTGADKITPNSSSLAENPQNQNETLETENLMTTTMSINIPSIATDNGPNDNVTLQTVDSLEVMQTQMDKLQTDLATLKLDSLETIQKQIRSLEAEITTVQSSCRETMKTQISSLKTDMTTLKSIETIQSKIDKLEADTAFAFVKSNISGIHSTFAYCFDAAWKDRQYPCTSIWPCTISIQKIFPPPRCSPSHK